MVDAVNEAGGVQNPHADFVESRPITREVFDAGFDEAEQLFAVVGDAVAAEGGVDACARGSGDVLELYVAEAEFDEAPDGVADLPDCVSLASGKAGRARQDGCKKSSIR